MSTRNCTKVLGTKKAISYGEILKDLPGRTRDMVTARYREIGGDLDRVNRRLLAEGITYTESRLEIEHPLYPERETLRNIRRRIEPQ